MTSRPKSALLRMLWCDEPRPLRMCRECVRDAAQEDAPDRPPSALATDDQRGVDLLSDLVDRPDHRFVGLCGACDRVVSAPAGTLGALLGDLLCRGRLPLVDLAFVRYGYHERPGSSQLQHCRRPYRQYHGIAGLDQ